MERGQLTSAGFGRNPERGSQLAIWIVLVIRHLEIFLWGPLWSGIEYHLEDRRKDRLGGGGGVFKPYKDQTEANLAVGLFSAN